MCTDGKVRTCHIRGKIKRGMWIRDNDLVLVSPWDFQSDKFPNLKGAIANYYVTKRLKLDITTIR